MFISFEGGEGTGKTTLSRYLFEQISVRHSVILTKEPSDNKTFFSVALSKILFQFYNQIDFHTEALLYAANRIQHLQQVIIPALKQNQIVICDRYLDSSIAYQGYARQLGENFIKSINSIAYQTLPNITFYLNLEPEIAIQRLKIQRKAKIEYFDLENFHFHHKVREGYLNLCFKYPQRIYKIDASKTLEEIKIIIKQKVQELLRIKI